MDNFPPEILSILKWVGIIAVFLAPISYAWRINRELHEMLDSIAKSEIVCGTCVRQDPPRLSTLEDHDIVIQDHDYLATSMLEFPEMSPEEVKYIRYHRNRVVSSVRARREDIR